ncbi:hypothetical protein [Nocardia sp. NPDC049149]|uniref:hypothetical protein n=1 Tax=Nocardia sp. NPDC049149 TaxID=3364315 RepID=UPI00371DBF60
MSTVWKRSTTAEFASSRAGRHRLDRTPAWRGLCAAAAFASLSTAMMSTAGTANADIFGLPLPVDPVGAVVGGAQDQLPAVGAAIGAVAPGVDVAGIAQGALDTALPPQANVGNPVRDTLQSMLPHLT